MTTLLKRLWTKDKTKYKMWVVNICVRSKGLSCVNKIAIKTKTQTHIHNQHIVLKKTQRILLVDKSACFIYHGNTAIKV